MYQGGSEKKLGNLFLKRKKFRKPYFETSRSNAKSVEEHTTSSWNSRFAVIHFKELITSVATLWSFFLLVFVKLRRNYCPFAIASRTTEVHNGSWMFPRIEELLFFEKVITVL